MATYACIEVHHILFTVALVNKLCHNCIHPVTNGIETLQIAGLIRGTSVIKAFTNDLSLLHIGIHTFPNCPPGALLAIQSLKRMIAKSTLNDTKKRVISSLSLLFS